MWKSFPDGNGGFVIYQIDDVGNKIGNFIGDAYPTKVASDLAVRGMVTESGQLLANENGGYGPTVVAVAATNEPFIGLKDHPSEIIEFDGTRYVRVPFLLQGYYNHPWYGSLTFNQPMFDRIIQNHVMGTSETPVYYRVRHAENPAVAFFDINRGGWFQEEEVNGDKLLVGYGQIVEETRATETVRDYVCASMDLYDDYIPTRVQKYAKKSPIRFYSINSSWIFSRKILRRQFSMKRKVTIAGVTIEVEVTDAGYVLDDASIEQLQGISVPEANDELQTKVGELEVELSSARASVQTLEKQVKDLGGAEDEAISPVVAARIKELERRAEESEKREFQSAVRSVVEFARNFRDTEGHGHSQVFVDWVGKFIELKPVGTGNDTVKLSSANFGIRELRQYMVEGILWLTRNQPGVVPFENKSQGDDDNPMKPDDTNTGDEAKLAELTKKAVGKYVAKTNFKGKDFNKGGAK